MSFVVKYRGTPTRTTIADYECPAHGRFEATVERNEDGDPPVEIACERRVVNEGGLVPSMVRCGLPCEWRISAPLARVRQIEAVKGGWTKPERKTWTDTRNIGEGQPLYEWREDRAKIWEEKRKEDVVRFAREHNERVIGGD